MAKIDKARAREILNEALAASGSNKITEEHASDYAALGPLFVEIFRIMFPGSDVALKEGGLAVIVQTKDDPHAISLGLTSTMDRLDPVDLDGSRRVIEEKIASTSTVFDDVFRQIANNEQTVSPVDRDLVVPLIMSREIFESTEARSGGKSPEGESPLVGWRLLDGVVSMASLDRGSAFQHVFSSNLADLGLNRDEVRILSMRNLKKLYAAAKHDFDYRERLFEVGGMNGLASSLILLDDFLSRQRKKLGDDLVIHLVRRETLVFFRKKDKELLFNVMLALVSGHVGNLVEGALFEYDGKLKLFWPEGLAKPN
ncbi:hypothetical protein OIU34_19410 [Pararhizobium sp. BT-229]|uniref:hypothetical protein n=1 Tax=Pararhizobium sp. BT-229 TaxID=2986923 RepID=UPI0021F7E5F2|nr:hypothetical protein [Pararhizobium sp. BT-229]MCV9964052.1 hypothetical protein [Pararhizobium sp. BT-229]